MNLDALLNTHFDCECGRQHHVPVKQMVYAQDALDRLPEVLSECTQGRSVAILADQRTWDIAGSQAEASLVRGGWTPIPFIVPDTAHAGPVCDDVTHQWLNANLPSAHVLLAVGSGVINDLTKWVAFERDLPYVVCPTAATMNGYTAANVAPTIQGVKTLVRARAPQAVLAVPSTLVEAPFFLTAAGLGDTIAKPVSTADWLLNHLFCGEYFCRFCSEMINTLEPNYFDHPQDIKQRRPEAIAALFQALLYSGIAMTVVGTSAPASGGEHLLSHTLDMMSSVDGRAHDLHGRQVGLGTLFASALYERICRIPRPALQAPPSGVDRGFWGPLGASVGAQYAQKQPLLGLLGEKLADRGLWQSFLDACAHQVRPPQQIKACLQQAGAAHTFSHIGCSRQRLLDAIGHMHEIRKRPTVVDLAWMLGVLPGAAEDIVDQWLIA